MSKFKHDTGEIWNGDCLELMKQIPDESIDMILCDLPYGTTACKWDTVIPFEPLWEQYLRITKPRAAIVLTAQTPFDKILGCSQIKHLKYEWLWEKNKPTGHLNSKKQPMKSHENVLVFYRNKPVYNPQMTQGKKYKPCGGASKLDNYGNFSSIRENNGSLRYPLSIQRFNVESGIHPTQKPVALFEYLIRTYTNEGDWVLDNCSGSGTTAIAAHRTGRLSLCIEKDLGYFLASCGRVWGEQNA